VICRHLIPSDHCLHCLRQALADERDACTELLLEIKRKCQDADRLWQIEEFVDEAIRARGAS
jgi:hypothetical protein